MEGRLPLNRKGFTLAELLVALGLMVTVVFVFTPFMLSSLNSVRVAGEKRQEIFAEKGELEELMAKGIDYTASDDDDESLVVPFRRNGVEVLSSVRGVVLQSTDKEMTTFLAKDTASLSITPSKISENSPNDTVIQIFCDFIDFTDLSLFKLTENPDGGATPASYTNGALSPVAFVISAADPRQATLTISDTSIIDLANAPYWVCYGDIKARLDVTPSSLIAVGENGAYYVKKGGQWQLGITPASVGGTGLLGSVTLRDAVWADGAYVAAGDSGRWYHTGNGSWSPIVIDSRYSFLDLHFSPLTGRLLSAGYYHDEAWLWIIKLWDLDYRYYQDLTYPTDLSASYSGDEGYYGDAVTTGYVGADATAVQAYHSTSNNNSRITAGAADLAVLNGSRVTAIAANDRSGNDSEFILTAANGKIYNYKYSGGSYVVANNGDTPDTGRQLRTDKPAVSKYVYTLTNPTGTLEADILLPLSATGSGGSRRYFVTYEGETYQLRNRTGSCYYVTETYYERSTVTVSGDLRGVAYGNDTWVAVGGTTQVNATNAYSKDVVSKAYSASSSSTPVWVAGSTTTTTNVADNPVTGQQSSTILYRAGSETGTGQWSIATPPSGFSTTALNKVEFLGGKFYAVGNSGAIFSSENGVTWTAEAKKTGQTLNANLYGIAGWGD